MPTVSYEDLLRESCPKVIETEQEYETVMRQFAPLFRKGKNRTPQETKFMRLLGLLIQDYDSRHSLADDSTPAERLQWLLDESGKTVADLLPVFGQPSHVNEALRGKRPISATQARKLGALFHLKPGYFL